MESREIQQLAIELEAEELTGSDGRPLGAEDIFPVIEALWGRGADLRGLVEGEVPDGQAEDEVAIGSVSQD